MGLAITIGILAEFADEDPEESDEIRTEFQQINDALGRAGLPPHEEPEALEGLDDRTPVVGFPYSCLHTLRRVYAHHVASGQLPPPLDPNARASEDPVVARVGSPRHHLLWHSDSEGYYVPIDFPEVIEDDDIVGGGFGSSQRLHAELTAISAPLGIDLENGVLTDLEAERLAALIDEGTNPYETEIMVWLALFEASRLSIKHRTAIYFG